MIGVLSVCWLDLINVMVLWEDVMGHYSIMILNACLLSNITKEKSLNSIASGWMIDGQNKKMEAERPEESHCIKTWIAHIVHLYLIWALVLLVGEMRIKWSQIHPYTYTCRHSRTFAFLLSTHSFMEGMWVLMFIPSRSQPLLIS